MDQTIQSLKADAKRLKRAEKKEGYKQQVVALNAAVVKLRTRLTAESARADKAERGEREAASACQLWRRRALEAESELKSWRAQA